MATDSNSVRHDRDTIVNQCWESTSRYLQETMEKMLDEVDDELNSLLDSLVIDEEDESAQAEKFDAQSGLRVLKIQAPSALIQKLEEQYQTFWQGGTLLSEKLAQEEEEENHELSLMEVDTLEEEVAIVSMTNRANDSCQMELLALNMRLAHLTGREELSNESNPLAPSTLALAMREVLDAWETPPLARKATYRTYERTVMAGLNDFYKSLNRYLVEQGVLPDLKQSMGKILGRINANTARWKGPDHPSEPNIDEASSSPNSSSLLSEPVSEMEGGDVPPLSELWERLSQLGTTVPGSAIPGSSLPSDSELVVMPKSALVETLSNFQNTTFEELPPDANWAQAKEQIAQQLTQFLEHNQRRIALPERKTIDIILILFNHVLEDPNLPDAMRAQIARLQIPVVKAAIVDDSFLHNKEHPARKLIDDLAEASLGWRDDGNRNEDSLYFHVKKAVDRIVHDFDEDIALFQEVRDEFAKYMARREQAKKIQEERLARSASGEDKINLARLQVDELLDSYETAPQPVIIRELLRGPWKKLLVIIWLKEGDKGSNWKKAAEIARILSQELSEKTRTYDREKLASMVPEIMKSLRSGLKFVAVSSEERKRIINNVQDIFISILTPERAKPETEIIMEEAPMPEKESAQREAEPYVPDKYDEMAEGLKENEWIRLQLPDSQGGTIVCKLVWRSHYTGTMVFVDGQGNKAAQMKAPELAAMFRKGTATLLKDVRRPLIDRAIHKMMKMLGTQGPRVTH